MFGILLLWGLFLNGAATVIDQHGSTVLGCAGQADGGVLARQIREPTGSSV